MIQSLYIRNYVLIDQLDMQFSEGFTTITGETGAGKSILMGALALILGQRVDTSVLKLKDSKCIVEGTFRTGDEVRKLFDENDLDFESLSTLRREVSPGGKSRAFINDTPVNLPLLKEIGNRLVDIHSQHHNLQLNDQLYQLEVIDYLADTGSDLAEFQRNFKGYSDILAELEKMKIEIRRMKEDLDFMQFQYSEINSAHIKKGEQAELESELQRAEHAEDIRNALYQSVTLLSSEATGILDQLKEALSSLGKISNLFTPAMELFQRMESAYIELKDLSDVVYRQAEKTDLESGKLEELQERMNLLFTLMEKHRVRGSDELIAIRDQLEKRIEEVTFSDEKILALEDKKGIFLESMEKISAILHLKRAKAGEEMQKEVESQLRQLGIPNARFKVEIEGRDDFNQYGADDIRFLFSANKQVALEEISRVASGGEVSRLMLCIKALVSDRKGMPTLIFDEIDAGVSGEIADKVGIIMEKLAGGRQVVAITHLPQVASRGSDHFIVYKEDTDDATYTRINKLNKSERIAEIARMLSGEAVSEEALSNARVLLRV